MKHIKSTTSATSTKSTTKVNQAIDHQPLQAEHSETTFQRAYARFEQAREELMQFFGTPGWKRTIVALISTIATIAGLGWVGVTITEYAIAGAVMAGAGAFIQIAILVLGMLITARVAYKVAVRVGGAVLTGEADERAIAAYDAMRNLASKLNPFKRIVAA